MDHRVAAVHCALEHGHITHITDVKLDGHRREPLGRLHRRANEGSHAGASLGQLTTDVRSDESGGAGHEHEVAVRAALRLRPLGNRGGRT
jgi:hypothetical protein